MSYNLREYASYARVAEAHLALAEEINSKDRNSYNLGKDKMQKWIYNILNIFESRMLKEGNSHYTPLINILRENIARRFERIDNLEGVIK